MEYWSNEVLENPSLQHSSTPIPRLAAGWGSLIGKVNSLERIS
jgi:hypothetical protein